MASGPWTAGHALVMAAMWIVMMAVMMLPSAAPMVRFHAAVARQRAGAGGSAGAASAAFVLGYLALWSAFGLAATALQYALERLAWVTPMMQAAGVGLAATLLIAAGLYQWTPLKQACLRQCSSPLGFVMAHWRDGAAGAFAMGARHGVACVGCCGVLMLLLFVGGVMNPAWIGGLALFVAAEKLLPASRLTSRAAGALLVAWGVATLWGGT
jgi:predicted metal-binding membrane protein